MDRKKLEKIRFLLDEMAKSPRGRKYREFTSIAKKLGRVEFGRREPTFIRDDGPALRPPLSIPKHTKDMPVGTAQSIIEALLSDVDVWDEFLTENEKRLKSLK